MASTTRPLSVRNPCPWPSTSRRSVPSLEPRRTGLSLTRYDQCKAVGPNAFVSCDMVMQLEGFRYRVEDIKRAVTKIAVKEARLAEIKQEVREGPNAISLGGLGGAVLLRRLLVSSDDGAGWSIWQIMNSEKLKSHFDENPHEFQVRLHAGSITCPSGWSLTILHESLARQILRHDKGILPSNRIKEHLKHVPDYLLPQVGQ